MAGTKRKRNRWAIQQYRGAPPAGPLVGGVDRTGRWRPSDDALSGREVMALGAFLDTDAPTAFLRRRNWQMEGNDVRARLYDAPDGPTLDVTTADGMRVLGAAHRDALAEVRASGGDYAAAVTHRLKAMGYRYVYGGGYMAEKGELLALYPEDLKLLVEFDRKRNGRFGVGALVGAQYRRPSSNQPWHHPRYSGDPADPGHGWTGEVIAYNDPRLWANTLQFPGRTPTQEEVDAHLAHYAEVVRQSPPHVQRALREERVPVLWEYGSASLEDETGLFGVAGPVQRKRNGVRGVKDSVRMRLTRMRDEGAPLIVAMEEEGLRVNQPFSLLMLDEALSSEVMQAAVDALTGEYGNAWEDLVFADGTRIDDPGATMLTVHEIKSKPGGLQGTTYHYDVTVNFPTDGRYKPNGRRQRDDATLDLFAARTQPRLLAAAAQPRMATLEDLATAPLGSLLMTADRTRAYRHATAGKSGWVPQMHSASSPDGWKDRGGHAQPPGLRLFRVLTDMMAREAFYLSPPVFVAAKRNARRRMVAR